MKIGLSSAAYYGQLETDEAAAHIAELPLDTCEVFLETPSEYTTDFTFRMRYNMNNFPVTSVHPLGTQFEPQLFGRAARQSDDAFAMFANVCRAAESLGAAYYIFHGPFGVRGHLSPANIPFLEERFDQMRERAARHHLRVLWESVSWCSVATPEDVRILLKRIPDVEFVLDTKQVHQAGVDPLPGRGVFDWQQFARVLREDGFDGAVILEPYAQLVESEQALLESIRFLRGVFGVPAQM